MARFVEKYPELKSKGLAVSKHVALMSHIASTVETRRACAAARQAGACAPRRLLRKARAPRGVTARPPAAAAPRRRPAQASSSSPRSSRA